MLMVLVGTTKWRFISESPVGFCLITPDNCSVFDARTYKRFLKLDFYRRIRWIIVCYFCTLVLCCQMSTSSTTWKLIDNVSDCVDLIAATNSPQRALHVCLFVVYPSDMI